ncbi:MAG: hypothetical protein AB7G17_03820 [Phycisphaerales bacterium]
MGTRLTITPPGDYVLRRDVCSYGYFLLAPNRWEPKTGTLERVLGLSEGSARVVIGQEGGAGGRLGVKADRGLSKKEQGEAKRQIARMLSLEDEGVGEFHRVDPRWSGKVKGNAKGRGRLFRSPTFFEDLIKTVTSCNVAWPSTVRMNQRLCEVFGPAFPSEGRLARARASTLRGRCGVGYRDKRMVELAKLVAGGEVDPEWFEDPGVGDEEVYEALLELPGIGPYSAANVLQLLGRYSRLAIDTESIRHGKTVLGMEGTDAEVTRALEKHYSGFGRHKFRSYWFELWTWYEGKRGAAWTWSQEEVGSSFTAAAFRQEEAAALGAVVKKGVARRGRARSG